MINKFSSNLGIPIFSEGSLKTWQKVLNYHNNFILGSKRIEKTKIPAFVLPYNSNGAQISKVELFKIIGAISNSFSYAYFKNLRSLVYEISLVDIVKTFTFENITFNSFFGKTVSELTSGVYEIIITMNDATVFESETLLVGCPEIKQSAPSTSSVMYKTETFSKIVVSGQNIDCLLTSTPVSGSIIIFVNGQFINNSTVSLKTVTFLLNYDIAATDIITIIYAYN